MENTVYILVTSEEPILMSNHHTQSCQLPCATLRQSRVSGTHRRWALRAVRPKALKRKLFQWRVGMGRGKNPIR